jgi:hypothetical protein
MRFRQEAKVGRQLLNVSGFVGAHYLGHHKSKPFYVMEYIPNARELDLFGGSLEDSD